MNKINNKTRMNNTRIFVEALLKGKVKLCYEVHDNVVRGVYVPKELSEETLEEVVTLKEAKLRAEAT